VLGATLFDMNFFVLFASGILLLNAAASLAVARNVVTPSQRRLQIVFIWLLPFVGAIVCLGVLASQSAANKKNIARGPTYVPTDISGLVVPPDSHSDSSNGGT
jgi:hypothetical protein